MNIGRNLNLRKKIEFGSGALYPIVIVAIIGLFGFFILEGGSQLSKGSPDSGVPVLIVTPPSGLQTLGSELVTNGSFTGNTTGWTLGNSWTFGSNRVAHITSSGSPDTLEQTVSITSGKRYMVSVDVTGMTTGSLTLTLGGTSGQRISGSSTGTVSQEIIAGSSDSNIKLTTDDAGLFNGSIGKVSVTEILSTPPSGAVPNSGTADQSLQLRTFGYTRIPTVNGCISNPFNEEPDIFFASDPAAGGTAPAGSQLRVWVDDGNGGSIAQGEIVDSTTGQITTPGDRTGNDGKGSNYYLWESAIYLTPISSPGQPGPFAGDAENGGTPHFPTAVKGEVSYADQGNKSGFVKGMPPIDTPVNVVAGRKGHGGHIAEFIWDINSLGLAPGSGYYRAQIVVHDGDGDLAVNCTFLQL